MPLWKRRTRPPIQPQGRPAGLAFGLLSDIGKVRTSNQDHLFALLTSLPGLRGQLALGLFIVADGMGGHAEGATASARAIEIVAVEVLQGLLLPVLRRDSPQAIQNVLREAVLEANRRIMLEAADQGSDMGTTLTAAFLLGERCYAAHIGDCRLYTYGEEGLECRTRDHSMVARLQELGQISAEEARHHPKRNYLYQSVGQQEDIEVDILSFPLDRCRYLLLCSDGLWGGVDDAVLAEALASDRSPQEICDHLVRQANAAGGEDNISVIVVSLPEPTGPEPLTLKAGE